MYKKIRENYSMLLSFMLHNDSQLGQFSSFCICRVALAGNYRLGYEGCDFPTLLL
jgi:hypothetical protein